MCSVTQRRGPGLDASKLLSVYKASPCIYREPTPASLLPFSTLALFSSGRKDPASLLAATGSLTWLVIALVVTSCHRCRSHVLRYGLLISSWMFKGNESQSLGARWMKLNSDRGSVRAATVLSLCFFRRIGELDILWQGD